MKHPTRTLKQNKRCNYFAMYIKNHIAYQQIKIKDEQKKQETKPTDVKDDDYIKNNNVANPDLAIMLVIYCAIY